MVLDPGSQNQLILASTVAVATGADWELSQREAAILLSLDRELLPQQGRLRAKGSAPILLSRALGPAANQQ